MPLTRIDGVLERYVQELQERGTAKGRESVVTAVFPPAEGRGPRVLLAGQDDRRFLRMNSNSYLGMSLRLEVIEAEEKAARRYGAGPGAVRFISGTYAPHVELERRLAAFHGREAAMIFSSAYAAVVSVIVPLTTSDTIIISDELNHNCIINGMRLARPLDKAVYPHLDLAALERELEKASGRAQRVLVITDGIFSMRGDHAPLAEISELVGRYDDRFPENALLVVDDSHGVGAFGATGRGTEEFTGGVQADVLVATLGKALGVNGGYVTSSADVIRYLRESSPMYIYSNPITPAEAHAALKALEILDDERGLDLLGHLRDLTARFERGLLELGYEIIPGEHPVVPLMVRDTARTRALVRHLFEHGILATGLTFPVVPRGDEEIRFQVNADHTAMDIDEVLSALAAFAER
jgi:glycine C-acetyltransferase